MKQTGLHIIIILWLQMVAGFTLISCSTENDEYQKGIHLRRKNHLNRQEPYLKIFLLTNCLQKRFMH